MITVILYFTGSGMLKFKCLNQKKQVDDCFFDSGYFRVP